MFKKNEDPRVTQAQLGQWQKATNEKKYKWKGKYHRRSSNSCKFGYINPCCVLFRSQTLYLPSCFYFNHSAKKLDAPVVKSNKKKLKGMHSQKKKKKKNPNLPLGEKKKKKKSFSFQFNVSYHLIVCLVAPKLEDKINK